MNVVTDFPAFCQCLDQPVIEVTDMDAWVEAMKPVYEQFSELYGPEFASYIPRIQAVKG